MKEMSGVDLRHVRLREASDLHWERGRPNDFERWCRNWMGLRDSPYRSIQLLIRLKIEAYGNRWDRSNPFHWEKVIYNLPGTKNYSPGFPWVIKVRFEGHLACEVYVHVEDIRVIGQCRELCWLAARKFALGAMRFVPVCFRNRVHDASRKKMFPSQEPGPWVGTICHRSRGEIIGTVSHEKWEKTRELVKELATLVEGSAIMQEQECKVADKTKKEMLEEKGFSEGLKFLNNDCWR